MCILLLLCQVLAVGTDVKLPLSVGDKVRTA